MDHAYNYEAYALVKAPFYEIFNLRLKNRLTTKPAKLNFAGAFSWVLGAR